MLKEQDVFYGNVVSSRCVETAKSTISVELIVSNEETRRRFSFGVKDHLCKDAAKLFRPNYKVLIDYRSIDGWFTEVIGIHLNGKKYH